MNPLREVFANFARSWESLPSVPPPDQRLVSRAPALISAAEELSGAGSLGRLRTCIAARDPGAMGALVILEQLAAAAAETLLEACKEMKRAAAWAPLAREAPLAARLMAALGRDDGRALAAFLLASALRARGDAPGAIEAFRECIAAAEAAHDERLLAIAHGNLANQLSDIGELDAALTNFDRALHYERDRAGRRVVLMNKSRAMAALGELRAAAQVEKDWIAELERAGAGGTELAIALDNAAITVSALGEAEAAVVMLERARALFPSADLAGLAVNALSRAGVFQSMDRREAAAQAFLEAHEHAFALARGRLDPEHYRRGFAAAHAARLPRDDEAYKLFTAGLQGRDAEAQQDAGRLWGMAAQRARGAGDHAFALRIEANAAALLFEAGAFDLARQLAGRVRGEAGQRGLALPESMASGTLGSLEAERADGVRHALGRLGAYADALALFELQCDIVAKMRLDERTTAEETYDTGSAANQLAKLAESFWAHELATGYCRHAVERARALKDPFRLANRLCGLHALLHRSARPADASPVARELADMVEGGTLPQRGAIMARKALALEFRASDRPAAIAHLRKACALIESLRSGRPRGEARSEVIAPFRGMPRELARLLRQAGDAQGAFEALQRDKGRRLIDLRAASEPALDDGPLSRTEAAALLARVGGEAPSLLVDFAVEEDGVAAYLVDGAGIRALHVAGDPSLLARVERGDVREREQQMVALCQADPLILELAASVQRAAGTGRRLFLVPDQALHNLPLHIAPVGARPWCDQAAIGYLPAAAALRLCGRPQRAAGRSLVAGDSRGDLPAAREECRHVAGTLGTRPLIGEDCTWDAIRTALAAGGLDFVHLAVHGRGDVQRGGRASVLLAGNKGDAAWVPFQQLLGSAWQADLVVFSGCSTAVAGLRHGRDLLSVVSAAAETGAGAIVGCLWPVGDEAAATFMKALYDELVPALRAGPVDLREALDRARAALREPRAASARGARRDGQGAGADAAGPLEWGPFILVGDPILGRR